MTLIVKLWNTSEMMSLIGLPKLRQHIKDPNDLNLDDSDDEDPTASTSSNKRRNSETIHSDNKGQRSCYATGDEENNKTSPEYVPLRRYFEDTDLPSLTGDACS